MREPPRPGRQCGGAKHADESTTFGLGIHETKVGDCQDPGSTVYEEKQCGELVRWLTSIGRIKRDLSIYAAMTSSAYPTTRRGRSSTR